MWMIAANFRWTHSPSRLAWSEGWRQGCVFMAKTIFAGTVEKTGKNRGKN